jgi:putative ABC transport system permease protein
MTILALAWRRLRRGWRSGELLVLGLAIAVAVAAASAVGSFSSRISQALEASSGEALGADRLLSSRKPLPLELTGKTKVLGLRTADTVSTTSVVLIGEESTLASVKAVSNGYPLRGTLRIAPEPLSVAAATQEVPAPGEAWADPRLWSQLKLARNAEVQVGATRLRVTASLEYEPDRGGGFSDLAPRLLMNLRDLPATELIQPASRVRYTLMASGPTPALEALSRLVLPPGVKLLGPDDARPEVRQALDRAGRFINLAVLAAALLSGCAIAICAHRHAQKLRDEVALLKCLGARGGRIAGALSLSLMMLSLIASLVGLAIGYGVQELIAGLLGRLLDLPLSPVSWAPLLQALALGLLMAAAFALPPIAAARATPPLRVFQRDAGEAPRDHAARFGVLAVVGLLLWLTTGDLELAGIVLGATAVGALVLTGVAMGLVAALAPFKRRAGVSWRFGLANISRRRGASIAQIVALGLALHALLLITLGRQDLLHAWSERVEPDAPNQFLVNIQPEQKVPLQAYFAERGLPVPQLMPMARARLLAINDRPVATESFDDPEARDWINREFNLSWTSELGEENKVIEGEWWGEAGRGQPWISVDESAARRLHLKLGDRLKMQIAEREIELSVRSLRKVRWDSFKPNFFLVLPPGVIEDAPAQWITSFYLSREGNRNGRAFLRELSGLFPNVTVLDIDLLMTQVRTLVERVVSAMELLFLFTLAAGITVLLALMEGTREERAREIGLLRALGARRATVVKGLLAEYGVLGLLAGAVGALLAQAAVWALALQVFELPYIPRPWLLLVGALSGAVLVAGLGWLSLRRTLDTPPRQVLQA